MTTTTQTPTETQKISAEEAEKSNTDMTVMEEKAPNVGSTNQETGQVIKDNEVKDIISQKIERKDSLEADFEMIATGAEEVQNKLKQEIKGETIEPIELIEDINAKDSDAQDTKNITNTDSVADQIQKDIEFPQASIIDIKIIKESEENPNKESSDSDAHSSEELEAALEAMPELSSPVSKDILSDANEEVDVKKIVGEIETKTEEKPEGTLIDITVMEETNKEKDVQELIKAEDHSFEAEVIEDNAEIQVVPSDDEDVIEYTIEAKDAVPIFTILVALLAIFIALFFYYN